MLPVGFWNIKYNSAYVWMNKCRLFSINTGCVKNDTTFACELHRETLYSAVTHLKNMLCVLVALSTNALTRRCQIIHMKHSNQQHTHDATTTCFPRQGTNRLLPHILTGGATPPDSQVLRSPLTQPHAHIPLSFPSPRHRYNKTNWNINTCDS